MKLARKETLVILCGVKPIKQKIRKKISGKTYEQKQQKLLLSSKTI
jgi:hypothetical protein